MASLSTENQGPAEALFAARPRGEEELGAKLEGQPTDALRRALIARLRDKGAQPCEVPVYVRAFDRLGLSPADAPLLADVLLDERAPISGRAVTLALLTALDPSRVQVLARRVSQVDLLAMSDAQLTVVIAGMPGTPVRVHEIADKLARQPLASRKARLGQIDRLRRRLGVPAALLYREALGREELGLGDALVDIVVGESGPGAAALVESLWSVALSEHARSRWSTVMARIYAARGLSPVAGLFVQVFEAGPSAEGERQAVAAIESPIDGSLTLARVRTGPSGAIVAGAVQSFADGRDLTDALAAGPLILSRVPARAAEVGAWVEAAASRTPAAVTFDQSVHAALCYFAMAARTG